MSQRVSLKLLVNQVPSLLTCDILSTILLNYKYWCLEGTSFVKFQPCYNLDHQKQLLIQTGQLGYTIKIYLAAMLPHRRFAMNLLKISYLVHHLTLLLFLFFSYFMPQIQITITLEKWVMNIYVKYWFGSVEKGKELRCLQLSNWVVANEVFYNLSKSSIPH